jgi:hypothetical protein
MVSGSLRAWGIDPGRDTGLHPYGAETDVRTGAMGAAAAGWIAPGAGAIVMRAVGCAGAVVDAGLSRNDIDGTHRYRPAPR